MIRTYKYFSSLRLVVLVLILSVTACVEDPTPKPKAFLSLEYPEPMYKTQDLELPFSFESNLLASQIRLEKLNAPTESYAINIEYEKLKGTIYLTYKSIDKKEAHLRNFLRDAQNFTQQHTKKADEIIEQPFEDAKRKVYGMLYEVGGNAASQSQFYVTDSTDHFLVGSLYFYAKPNYDSILPAAHYLQKDIKRLIETISWREK